MLYNAGFNASSESAKPAGGTATGPSEPDRRRPDSASLWAFAVNFTATVTRPPEAGGDGGAR